MKKLSELFLMPFLGFLAVIGIMLACPYFLMIECKQRRTEKQTQSEKLEFLKSDIEGLDLVVDVSGTVYSPCERCEFGQTGNKPPYCLHDASDTYKACMEKPGAYYKEPKES